MPVPSALSTQFSSSARSRGEAYAAEGRVRLTRVSPRVIEATVRGRDLYDVRLAVRQEPDGQGPEIEVACTCPHFYDGAGTCKHIWAAIVTASKREDSFLAALHGEREDALEVVPVFGDGMADLGDDEDTAEDGDEIARQLRNDWARRRRRALEAAEADWQSRRDQPARSRTTTGRTFVDGIARSLRDATPVRSGSAWGYPPRPIGPHYGPENLLYAIDLDALGLDKGLHVEVLARERGKDGAWKEPQPLRISAFDTGRLPPADAEIVAALAGAGLSAGIYGGYAMPFRFAVSTPLARLLIPRIAGTGRAVLKIGTPAGATLLPVAWDDGPAWTYSITAESLPDGLRLAGRFRRGDDVLDPAERVIALESGFLLTRRFVARAELPATRELFAALLKARTVDLSAAEASVLAEILAQHGRASSELPDALKVPEIDVAPVSRIAVAKARTWSAQAQLTAAVSFDYDGTVILSEEAAPLERPPAAWDAARRRIVRRRPDAEAQAFARLSALGLVHRWNSYEGRYEWRTSAAKLPGIARTLVAEGWHVEAEGRLLQRAGRVSLSVTSGIDWFDLQGSIEFSGETVPLTEVLAALKKGETSVRLGDGTFGLLPEEWLARYAPLAAMGEAEGDRLRFRLPQTALLDALLEAQAGDVAVRIDEQFESARRALSTFERVAPIEPPVSFQGSLRPYQKEGLGWLAFLQRFGFGGCLADDMGLGKTVMVLAMLERRRRERPDEAAARPSLVVAPRSLVHNWLAEAARFTPSLRVRDVSHAARRVADERWDDADVVIATYGTLRRDIATLRDRAFDYVILDEAQAIKNAATASAKAARLLGAEHRLALSGTPIENHLGELWSLFEFLNPGLLGRSTAFAAAGAARRTVEADTAALVSRAIRPFILRRTKAQVASDLPARTEQTITCELERRQRAFYDSLRAHYRQTLLGRITRMGIGRSKLQVLEALLRLRQAACHPGLVDRTAVKGPSAKLDVLLPRLREVVDEGHKAIVFSQFTSLLALVRDALEAESLVFEYLDGQTRDRAGRVERFQSDPDCGIFLVSLKAGGLGLNLTAAEYVFLLDPWWNPAVEAQAIDRAHRIGQTRHVFAYRLIAADTVEEKVLELQQSKRELADAILRADAGLIGQLGREDVELLLS